PVSLLLIAQLGCERVERVGHSLQFTVWLPLTGFGQAAAPIRRTVSVLSTVETGTLKLFRRDVFPVRRLPLRLALRLLALLLRRFGTLRCLGVVAPATAVYLRGPPLIRSLILFRLHYGFG
ncbi:MAG: hypothetical protein AAF840_11295, partial [Bacteroidota bacterium]